MENFKRSSRTSRHGSIPNTDMEDPNRDADEQTDEALAKQHSKHTIRGPLMRKNNKSKYNTARGQSIFWTPDDEDQHEVKAFVRDTAALQASHKWEELVGKGITHLIIEDDDNFMKEIPMEICQIQTLRSFKLMWSKVKLIPEHLFQITLKELCLHKLPLKSIDRIHRLEDLVSLELVNDGLKKIPMEIGEMTKLHNLDLTGNHLKSLPISIGNLCNLRVLKISGNSISEIPASLTELDHLITLDCSQNHIKMLPTEIGNLNRLVTFRISHNQISTLPPSFQHLKKLKHFYAGHNRFTEVPRLLGKLPSLQTLNLVSNHVKNIPCGLTNLTTLLLDKNELKELSESVFLCEKLEKLAVQNNQIESIPALIAHLKKLRALYIGGNNIRKLPEDICMLTNLRHFVVRETKVQELPTNFDQLQRLSMVDIEHTELDAMFSYRLKTDGIQGLMDQVRLKRESSGGEEEENQRNHSDHGSSQFDSEDEAESGDGLYDSDSGVPGGVSMRSHTGYDLSVLRDTGSNGKNFDRSTKYPPGMEPVGSRRDINTLYPQYDDDNQSNDIPELSPSQPKVAPLQEMFKIPDELTLEDSEKTIGKKEAERTLSNLNVQETSFIQPVQNGHQASVASTSLESSQDVRQAEELPGLNNRSSNERSDGTDRPVSTSSSGQLVRQNNHVSDVQQVTLSVQEEQDQIGANEQSPRRPLSVVKESRIVEKQDKPSVATKPKLAQKPSKDQTSDSKPPTSPKPLPPPVKPKPK